MRRRQLQLQSSQNGETLPQTMEQAEGMESKRRTRKPREKKNRCFRILRSCGKRKAPVKVASIIGLSFFGVIILSVNQRWPRGGQLPKVWTSHIAQIPNAIGLVLLPPTMLSRRTVLYPITLDSEDKEEQGYEDYGGLNFEFLGTDDAIRAIHYDFDLDEGEVLTGEGDDDVDYYYAFDDDAKRNPYVGWEDDKIQDEKRCRPTSWYRDVYLNCNSFHEFGLHDTFREGLTKYLAGGNFREVYRSNLGTESIIFKICQWVGEGGGEETFNYEDFDNMRKDMLVAERFSSNPYFVDIYGFCGLSIFSELMPYGDLEEYAVPEFARGMDLSFLNETPGVKPLNNFEPFEKLIISLQMAEVVAFLHNHIGGVIVHDDIQLPQFLMTSDGGGKTFDSSEQVLKLNDFNRAEVMLFDEENQEYCRYLNGPGHGDWRAPEEYHDKPLNEKIDIWSLGCNMYSVLTGMYPFYDLKEDADIRKAVKAGNKGYIDPRYRTRSYVEGRIAEAIDLCWEYDPDKRIDIKALVKLLRDAVQAEDGRQSMHAAVLRGGD